MTTVNYQRISDLAVEYCERKGYKAGPPRKLAYQGFVAGACEYAQINAELLAALESALLRLQTISGLMEDQVDQKLDGKRTRYNYKAAALQMNEEALAEIEDARAAILRVKGEQ